MSDGVGFSYRESRGRGGGWWVVVNNGRRVLWIVCWCFSSTLLLTRYLVSLFPFAPCVCVYMVTEFSGRDGVSFGGWWEAGTMEL